MNNKIIVRTDIINPHTYLDVEMMYKDLIETIYACGGYALFQQIYKYYGGKSKGYREIKRMEELLLVGTEQFNNNKYVYLKIIALRYLKYRDQEVLDGELTVNRLSKNPSFRPLMNSIYSFEYLLEKGELINADISLKTLNLFLDEVTRTFESNRLQNIHLANVLKDNYKEQLRIKLKILGDRNAIYLKEFIKRDTLDNSILKFVWYDFDQDVGENTVLRALTLISKFLNFIGTKNQLNCCKFLLEIVTISKKREQILQELSNRALRSIEKRNKHYLSSLIKSKENKVISNIEGITYSVLPDIEGYIKIAVRGDNEFNFADIDTVERIEKLKEVIKKNS